jgi:hypothetical protein
MLSVSELCCPVCWELLNILRGQDKEALKVRGYHTTLFPVELPRWLPRKVLAALFERFQKHLAVEVKKLIENDLNDLQHVLLSASTFSPFDMTDLSNQELQLARSTWGSGFRSCWCRISILCLPTFKLWMTCLTVAFVLLSFFNLSLSMPQVRNINFRAVLMCFH